MCTAWCAARSNVRVLDVPEFQFCITVAALIVLHAAARFVRAPFAGTWLYV
jgi:hypothetical protein